ncbi:unnamed protein product, partial [Amoebophrya sp. A25]
NSTTTDQQGEFLQVDTSSRNQENFSKIWIRCGTVPMFFERLGGRYKSALGEECKDRKED